MESNFIPKNLNFGAARLAGYSTNSFKITPTGSSTVTPGQQITWNLPENATANMNSLRLVARVTTQDVTNTVGGVTTTVHTKLPQDSSSLISRLDVSVNGTALTTSASEYNTTCRVLKNAGHMSRDRDLSVDRAISHGSISTGDASDVVDVVIQDFRGPLGGSTDTSCAFWPLNALGSVQITMTMAGPEILVPKQAGVGFADADNLSASAKVAAANMTYTVSDCYLGLDTISFGDSLYESLLRERLSQGNLEIFYKNYYTFTNDGIKSGASSTRFSVASTSIDKIYSTNRNSSYRSVGIRGHTLPDQALGDAVVGNYFRFMSFDTENTSKCGDLRVSHMVNSVMHPQYKKKAIESLADLVLYSEKSGVGAAGIIPTSLAAYHNGLYVNTVNLSHPISGMIGQVGYDSRGISSQLSYDVTGARVPGETVSGATLYPATEGQLDSISHFVVVSTTAKMIIGLGRECVVQF